MNKIKIKVHWSFFILGILMLFFGQFQVFLCCLLCVILHEMGHSFVGRKLGYKLNMITLLPYGAMLKGDDAPFDKTDEIKIAVAGPIVNAILVILCVALWWVFPISYNFTKTFVLANIYTFCFNVLPVFPLDGGRVFMAILSKHKTRLEAQKITKVVGYIITGVIFALFFASFFYKLNYMLGINALFLLIGLLEIDSGAYYEKLANFDMAKQFFKHKSIKLDENTPIFVAYKQVVENNINTIMVTSDANNIRTLYRSEILNNILTVPIDTKLKDIK